MDVGCLSGRVAVGRGWSRQDAVCLGVTRSKDNPPIAAELSGLSPAGKRLPIIGLSLTVTGRHVLACLDVRHELLCASTQVRYQSDRYRHPLLRKLLVCEWALLLL